jgi:hypothetical protein
MECLNDKHKPRDNKLGVTWCVRCGRLFNKPCGKDLLESDKVVVKVNSEQGDAVSDTTRTSKEPNAGDQNPTEAQ